jgi:hypothetical protein
MKHFSRHNKKVNRKDLMASRCFISVFKESFEYDSIFCADGHPEFTGNTLVRHYNDERDVIRLIEEGDVSNLGDTLSECKFYDEDFGFNRSFSSMDSMVQFYRECGCNYGYIYVGDEWKCIHITSNGTSPVNLNLLTHA